MHPLSHESAAQLWGLPLLATPKRHITVPRNHAHRPADTVAHRVDLLQSEVRRHDGVPVTSPERTVIDLARSLPFREALAVADAALRLRLVTPRSLAEAAARTRGPGARRIRGVVHHSDHRAASIQESFLRAILLMLDVGRICPQLCLHERGHPYDIGLPDLQILIECDSSYHLAPGRVARDCEDTSDAAVQGWPILRFSWRHLVHEPAAVEAAILTVAARQRLRLAAGPDGVFVEPGWTPALRR